jgi:hypothetical protein
MSDRPDWTDFLNKADESLEVYPNGQWTLHKGLFGGKPKTAPVVPARQSAALGYTQPIKQSAALGYTQPIKRSAALGYTSKPVSASAPVKSAPKPAAPVQEQKPLSRRNGS